MTDRRQIFWRREEAERLFTCIHQPESKFTGVGAVICGPVGFEAVHLHSAQRTLADSLAEAGIVTARFDYSGTGNSFGDHLTSNLVTRWQDDIRLQVSALRNEYGLSDIYLVGLRLGTALAALVARDVDARGLVAWEATMNGKQFAREVRAASLLARKPGAKDQGVMESGGFVFSEETLAAIKAIKIEAPILEGLHDICVLDRKSATDKKMQALCSAAVHAEFKENHEYEAAVRVPHLADLPVNSIREITEWLGEKAAQLAGTQQPNAQVPRNRPTVAGFQHEDSPLTEQLVTTEAPRLFGVYTSPRHPTTDSLVVLSNAGAVHNIGPNRTYVELARSLAQRGIPSLRIDLHNIGESVAGGTADREDLNHPYTELANENLAVFLSYASKQLGFERFVVGGLCSGSYTSFHAGLNLNEHNIREVLMINPLTFYWRDGLSRVFSDPEALEGSAKHYQYAMKDSGRWKRLIKGDIDFARLARFGLRFSSQQLGNLGQQVLESFRLQPLKELATDLRKLEASGKRITFVFSARDPGRMLLQQGAKRTVSDMQKRGTMALYIIDDADHTFTMQDQRAAFVSCVTEHLVKSTGPG